VTEPAVQEFVEARPAPRLRPAVRRYLGYAYSGLAPGVHIGLPSGAMTVQLAWAEPVDLVRMPGPQAPGAFDGLVGGLHLSPASIRHPGVGVGVSIDLSPVTCRSVFGLPASALFETVVDIRDVLGTSGDELMERLALATGWTERFAVLDEVLGRVVDERPPSSAEVLESWSLLEESNGRITVAELSDAVGWSRRHLATKFRAEFGLTPKSAARLIRFERTGELLGAGVPIADAAAVGGYFDQAHLTNDWKRLAGATPTEWLADELRHHRGLDELDVANLQDDRSSLAR
jgi:AraC-like DNA-binding protein